MQKLTEQQRSMMKHALGYGHKSPPGWRNHYALEPDGEGWDDWQDLISRGFAVDRGSASWLGELHILSVTELGRAALAAEQGVDQATKPSGGK